MKLARRDWLKLSAMAGAGASLLPGVSKAAGASGRASGADPAEPQQKWGMGVAPGQTLPPEATDGPWRNLRAVKEKKVFDVHCHSWETPAQGHNYKEEGHMHDLDEWKDYSKELIASMDRHGIAQAAMTPAFEAYETIVAASVVPHLDRFIRASGLPTKATKGKQLTPDLVAEECRAALERDGVKMIGETTGDALMGLQSRYSVNELKPIMDVVRKHDVPVQVHTGWTATGSAVMSGENMRAYFSVAAQSARNWPDYMGALLSTYPDIKFIMGHAGGALAIPDGWEAIRLLFSFDNAYIDTAKTPPEIISEAVRGVGAERVLFGTDWNRPEMKEYGPFHMRAAYQHWWNLNSIANADLTEDQRDWILYKSARKLLKLPPA